MPDGAAPVLTVKDLQTVFTTRGGEVHAVNSVSFDLKPGELLGVVGESGSGKSVTMMSLIGLLPMPPAEIRNGRVMFDGVDLLQADDDTLRSIRGARIGMIFQDPMTSLNPVFSVGFQISEPLRKHMGMNKSQARVRAAELLELVGIPDAADRLKDYPHQFSGGMRQRVMIAIALACDPQVLIADEPTTALERGVKRPLQIALSYDEEVGCLGAPPMIDDMVGMLPKAEAVIVGEPSMMQAVTGHKGGSGFKIHVSGFEVHSSLQHTGVNAIMEAARLIDWANEMNAQNMAKEPSAMAAIFEPTFTTVHVGEISGGTAHNITAGDCWTGLDFRVVPGENMEDWCDAFLAKVAEVEAEMKSIRPEAGIELKRYFRLPALRPEENGRAEEIVRAITGDNGTHVVSYGTEAGQFQERGFSAVVCGPGNIEQAHQADEFITVEQFEAGEKFLRTLVDQLAKG